MTTLLLSPSAGARREAALDALRSLEPAQPALVIGHSLFAARDLVFRAAAERGAAFGWEATTLSLLAKRLAIPRLAAHGLVPIGGVAETTIAGRVLDRLAASASLGRFAGAHRQPGLAARMARTLRELRLSHYNDAPPETLISYEPALATILAAYSSELAALGFADDADVYSAAADRARDADHWFAGAAVILLDVALRSPAEAALALALTERAPESLVTIAEGDDRTAHFFADADRSVRRVPVSGSSLEDAQQDLFSVTSPTRELDDTVSVLSAPSEYAECVEIARNIIKLVDSDAHFEDMAVVLRAPELYRGPLDEALRRAEIPAFFAHGVRRPDPMGRAFLCLLDCADEGLSARAFAEFLSLSALPTTRSGELPFEPPDDFPIPAAVTESPPADNREPLVHMPRRWERLIVDAAVIGGLDRWRRRLTGRRAEITQRRDALAGSDDSDDPRIAYFGDDLAAIDSLEEIALPILERVDAFPDAGTWGEWLAHLTALATAALAHPERVLSALADLEPLSPVGPVGLFEVRQALAPRLGELVARLAKKQAGRVFVGTPGDIRGLAFDHVFVCGLAETVFPKKILEDPILLDESRVALGEDADITLETSDDRARDERLAFRLAIGSARRSVCLTYPRLEGGGSRARVPSFYGLEAMRAASGALPGFSLFSRQAAAGCHVRMSWPAPLDSTSAIDVNEYDLAVLERLLTTTDTAATRGAARYLLESSDTLARALRFRARRWSLRTWTHADGLVDPPAEVLELLERFHLDRQSYSATSIQSFAACPYRFFLRTMLRLAPREAPAPLEELNPLQRGSLIHDIQFHFLRAMQTADSLPLSPYTLDDARRVLAEVTARLARRYRDDLAPAIERVWNEGVQKIEADLVGWLERLAESEWLPTHFELAFGIGVGGHRDTQRDIASQEAPQELDCGLKLKGSIDMVEESGTLTRATDHKTGRWVPPRSLVIGGGETLQPALYALALEKLFPGRDIAGGRLSFCTSAAGFAAVNVELDDGVRAAVNDLANILRSAFERGFFPASPRRDACGYCDYTSVCGPYEELRSRRKDPANIDALIQLRRHP